MENNIIPGSDIIVADCETNRDNAYWANFIGRRGQIAKVDGDGLLDVVIETAEGYIATPMGISPSRFLITPPPSRFMRFFRRFIEAIKICMSS